MLCETISHCEILSDSTTSRSTSTDIPPYGINTLLNEVSRLSQITSVAGGDTENRLQSSTRPTHTVWAIRGPACHRMIMEKMIE